MSNLCSSLLVTIVVVSLSAPSVAAGQESGAWRQADVLAPGTPVVVTLGSGEERAGTFLGATFDAITISGTPGAPSPQVRRLLKSEIRKVSIQSRPAHRVRNAAWAGAGVMVGLFLAEARGCGIGCEYGGSYLPLLGPVVGAVLGAGLGLAANNYADSNATVFPASASGANRFFPARPTLRVGTTYARTTFQSSTLKGRVMGPGVAVVWQPSPYVTARVEYSGTQGELRPAPGSVPDVVLQNLIAAPGRVASVPVGIEKRRVSPVFSPLLGFGPKPWGRLRLEVLAGLGVQAHETWSYYPENQTVGQTRQPTGKYYVLNFQTPETGVVLGVEAEVALVRGLSVAPTLRYQRMGDLGASTVVGVGAHWRF